MQVMSALLTDTYTKNLENTKDRQLDATSGSNRIRRGMTLKLKNRVQFRAQNSVTWLAPWAGKINWIQLRCDWLPEWVRWSYLARSGLPVVSRKKNALFPYHKSFIDQACSVKIAGYWPRSFFCEFMDLDSVSVHKHAKKELGQYPAILTEQAWSIKDLLHGFR